jgi:hypothetical protein
LGFSGARFEYSGEVKGFASRGILPNMEKRGMPAESQKGVVRRARFDGAGLLRTGGWTVSTRHAAYGLGASIAVLGLLGAFYTRNGVSALAALDLDGEWNVPALFSALLLVAASRLLLHVREVFPRPVLVYVFATLLLCGAIDEAVQIHENLEEWLDVDWQRLYAPVFLVVAIVWFGLLADLWRCRPARLLYIASASAWAGAQVLEHFQWNGDVHGPHYDPMMVAEEVLEMTGTALLILALLVVRDRGARARSGG